MMQPLPETWDEMSTAESKYMKKEDVDPPRLLTIAGFSTENLAREGEPPKVKWIMHFHEPDAKPLVLGVTNRELLKMALKVSGPREAINRKIVAFNDLTVFYQGKPGGTRLRAPKAAAVPVVDPLDDEVPF